MSRDVAYRSFVRGVAGAAAATTVAGTVGATESGAEWVVEETPTGSTIYDVAYTTAGAHAVGAGGTVLARR
jgi:hypothetical protein